MEAIKVYFDQNIFEDIHKKRRTKKISYETMVNISNFYHELNDLSKIEIYYSYIHIEEILKSNNSDLEIEQLNFLKEMTKNNYINNNLELVVEDPYKIYYGYKQQSTIAFKKLNLAVLDLVDYSKIFSFKEFGFDQNELNNIEPSKIKKHLIKKLDEMNSSEITAIKLEQIKTQLVQAVKSKKEAYYTTLNESLVCLMEDLSTEVEGLDKIIKKLLNDIYYIIPDMIIKNISESKGITDLIKLLDKDYIEQNTELENFIPALKVNFLETLNYNVDTKSNKKKNILEKQFDNIHLSLAHKCDVFITEDSKLIKKSIVDNDNGLKIFKHLEFIEWYLKQ